jgi:outer membrane protein assembly factor BamD
VRRNLLPMQKSGFLLLLLFALVGCDNFGKVLKSSDTDYKIERATSYMENGKYANALTLYENVFPLVRGTNKGEEVYFKLAECNYKLNDFYSASYYYGAFEKTFPKSDLAEKAAFLSAYCAYSTSPEFDLDQGDTQQAIESLQLFKLKYPQSPLLDSTQSLIQELLYKLEIKRFETAKTYHRTRRYRSASIAFANMIKDFPNTSFDEELYFLMFQSNFELAVNSVVGKKMERLEEAKKSYYNFVDLFPDSDRIKEVENQFKKVNTELEKLEKLNS